MIYFHKYFLTNQNINCDLDKYCICIASILTASKFCDQLIPLDKLILTASNLFKREIESNKYQNLLSLTKEKVLYFEFEILHSLAFDLNVSLPYKYIIQMKNYFTEYLKNPKLYQISYYYINDSFKLPLCLFYHPLYIALACIYLIELNFNINLPTLKTGEKWYEVIEQGIDFNIIKEVAFSLNKLYEAEKLKLKVSIPEKILQFDIINNTFSENNMFNDSLNLEGNTLTVNEYDKMTKNEECLNLQDISNNSTVSTSYFGNEYNKREI